FRKAAEVAGKKTDQNTDCCRRNNTNQRHQDIDSGSIKDTREDIASDLIGTKWVRQTRCLHQVHHVDGIWAQRRPRYDERNDDPRGHDGNAAPQTDGKMCHEPARGCQASFGRGYAHSATRGSSVVDRMSIISVTMTVNKA